MQSIIDISKLQAIADKCEKAHRAAFERCPFVCREKWWIDEDGNICVSYITKEAEDEYSKPKTVWFHYAYGEYGNIVWW